MERRRRWWVERGFGFEEMILAQAFIAPERPDLARGAVLRMVWLVSRAVTSRSPPAQASGFRKMIWVPA
jgi:hypothetical protein